MAWYLPTIFVVCVRSCNFKKILMCTDSCISLFDFFGTLKHLHNMSLFVTCQELGSWPLQEVDYFIRCGLKE